jgi:hypothetical protein
MTARATLCIWICLNSLHPSLAADRLWSTLAHSSDPLGWLYGKLEDSTFATQLDSALSKACEDAANALNTNRNSVAVYEVYVDWFGTTDARRREIRAVVPAGVGPNPVYAAATDLLQRGKHGRSPIAPPQAPDRYHDVQDNYFIVCTYSLLTGKVEGREVPMAWMAGPIATEVERQLRQMDSQCLIDPDKALEFPTVVTPATEAILQDIVKYAQAEAARLKPKPTPPAPGKQPKAKKAKAAPLDPAGFPPPDNWKAQQAIANGPVDRSGPPPGFGPPATQQPSPATTAAPSAPATMNDAALKAQRVLLESIQSAPRIQLRQLSPPPPPRNDIFMP